jgi:hypothetical protein
MMKQSLLFAFLTLATFASGQNTFDWDGKYKLQLSDFQSPSTQIGNTTIYSLHAGSCIDFAYYMTSAEFMFTKNFNSKVSCTFNREAASLVAPDSATAFELLAFARYEFDLCELYARKLRKQIFEEKGAFSDPSFFKPLFDENQEELNERHTLAGRESDLGRNKEKLAELHREVLNEIAQLSDFCKDCKPPKKKK